MTTYGITPQGFVLKRLSDIISDLDAKLSQVQDPVTLEKLILTDENDPLVQLRDALADGLAACWEQLQMAYNQFIPTLSSGAALSGLVQLNGLIRQVGELDTTLRLRQQSETAGTGYIQIMAIYAAVAAIPGVQFCRAYQNRTLVTDSRGIPAKSIAVVVVGGDPSAVATAIFTKAGADVGFYGNTMRTCYDTLGVAYSVSYITPVPVPITIQVSLTQVNDQWPQDGADRVKTALIAYAQYSQAPNIGLYPGASVIPSQLYSPVNSVPGHSVNSILVSRDGSVPVSTPTAIAWNEVAQLTAENITVTVS